jgi:hypothetical protein
MPFEYSWRGEFTNEALNHLHAEGFERRLFADDWWAQVTRHSLGWVHAFILDTVVAQEYRHQGLATEFARSKLAKPDANGFMSTL